MSSSDSRIFFNFFILIVVRRECIAYTGDTSNVIYNQQYMDACECECSNAATG